MMVYTLTVIIFVVLCVFIIKLSLIRKLPHCQIMIGEKNYETAIVELKIISMFNPENKYCLDLLGDAYMGSQKYDESLRAYEKLKQFGGYSDTDDKILRVYSYMEKK